MTNTNENVNKRFILTKEANGKLLAYAKAHGISQDTALHQLIDLILINESLKEDIRKERNVNDERIRGIKRKNADERDSLQANLDNVAKERDSLLKDLLNQHEAMTAVKSDLHDAKEDSLNFNKAIGFLKLELSELYASMESFLGARKAGQKSLQKELEGMRVRVGTRKDLDND